MIKNQKQYEYTQELIQSFESTLSHYNHPEDLQENHDLLHQIQRESLQSHLDILKAEIVEYEALIDRSDRPSLSLQLSDIQRLSEIPIKARIAANLSQKELAELAGLTEKKIKDYEKQDYQTASFLDFLFVLEALNIQVKNGEFLVSIEALKKHRNSNY
ncbi:MAG: helix-turn-helix transcriptional regulator [Cyanobacteriota bacterium]|nr:helix-turn-helix transcriptional regulator [Cyanobacteriota bacterium]